MKYALVTGASKGIGRATSILLAQQGYYVLINYNSDTEGASDTLKEIREQGGEGELIRFDVSSRQAVTTALSEWSANHKEAYIEVLVNNAGIAKDNLMLWMTEEEWKDVIDVNLHGFFYVTQYLLKNMLVKRYGRIINIVSLSGQKGMKGQANYSAAKAGVIAATKSLASEVGARNITVNAVSPGFIRTDMTMNIDEDLVKPLIPVGRFGTAEEVASLVGYLASPSAGYITGEVISVNGGLYT